MGPEQQPTNNQPYITPNNNPGQFSPTEPPKGKKTGLMVAIIVVVLIVVGIVVFAMMGSKKNTSSSNSNTSGSNSSSNNSAATSDKYQKYDVTDKPTGLTFSVSFYKDAKVEEKNGRTFLNSGETGSMYSVYLGAATGDKIDCGESPDVTMKLGGESTTVCYMSDKTQYAGYIKSKSGLVKLNFAAQQPISVEDATAVMESVSFK